MSATVERLWPRPDRSCPDCRRVIEPPPRDVAVCSTCGAGYVGAAGRALPVVQIANRFEAADVPRLLTAALTRRRAVGPIRLKPSSGKITSP